MLALVQVDDIGEVTITNDGATILKELEVEHPAARTLVELAERQDKEVGAGPTSDVRAVEGAVTASTGEGVSHAAPKGRRAGGGCGREGACWFGIFLVTCVRCRAVRNCLLCRVIWLQRANELVRQKIHPTTIIAGFRLARKEAVKYIKVRCCTGGTGFEQAARPRLPRDGTTVTQTCV